MLRNVGCAVILASILALSCRDKGPEPKPVKYNVYYGKSAQGHLYVLDADSLDIVDSIPGIEWATGSAVSPDGEWLYIESGKRPDPFSLKKINTSTKEIVTSIPDNVIGVIVLIESGRTLLRGREACRREVISTEQFVLTKYLDDSVCAMRGPESGSEVAALVGGTSRLRSVDVISGEVEGEYLAHLIGSRTIHVVDAVLHQDGRRVLALGTGDPLESWFVVGDLETGETLFQYQMIYAQGSISVNNDGTYATVTDPGRAGFWDTDPTLDIFDLRTLTHLKRFTGGTAGEIEGMPGQVCFLPNSDYVLTTPGSRGGQSGPIHLINLETLEIDRTVYPKISSGTPTALAVGIRP